MNTKENITSYLKSGKDDVLYGVRLRDLYEALLFLPCNDTIILQIGNRKAIPFIRRLIFMTLGTPDSERRANELKYGKHFIRIMVVNRDSTNTYGYPHEQVFYVCTSDTWDEVKSKYGALL